MIEMPRRSVTRFFIPLIDVLTLMFCIFLLMPVFNTAVEEAQGESGTSAATESPAARAQRLVKRLRQQEEELRQQIEQLQAGKQAALQQVALRVLEIGEEGRLFYFDPKREKDRRIELTAANVHSFLDEQKREAGTEDLLFVIIYPRPASGAPAYPLRSQREEYDRWFAGVAHSYDTR
jgi:hypothetical protein